MRLRIRIPVLKAKLAIVLMIIVGMIASCSTGLSENSIQDATNFTDVAHTALAETLIPSITLVPIKSSTPPSTATMTPTLQPTATHKPTQTEQPKPTATPERDYEAIIDQAANESGISFPAEVSTSYEDPNGNFGGSISFSEGLAYAGGFQVTEITSEFMYRVLLHTFGKTAYASIGNGPLYAPFEALNPQFEANIEAATYGDPRFITLVLPILEQYHGLPVTSDSDYKDFHLSSYGTNEFIFNMLDIHLLTSDEFFQLQTAFDANAVPYVLEPPESWQARRESNGVESRGMLVIDRNTLQVFAYGNGVNGDYMLGFKPMEHLRNSTDLKRLYALVTEIDQVSYWMAVLFHSLAHPDFKSIGSVGTRMEFLCADSLDNLAAYRNWQSTCQPTAEAIFK